jgi:hypothetical protein
MLDFPAPLGPSIATAKGAAAVLINVVTASLIFFKAKAVL